MDIQRFRGFYGRHFHLEKASQTLRDGRSIPKIEVASVFQALFYMGVLGLGSLLGVDQFLRTRSGKRLFGCVKPMVSDTTLSRSLASFELEGLHQLLEAVYAKGRHLGIGRCEVGGGQQRIGVIDGSQFGRFMASCFAEIGSVCLKRLRFYEAEA